MKEDIFMNKDISVNENKRIDILPQIGNLYKVNLHTHSTLSDGNFTPEELKRLYVSEGYSAVAFTDHRAFIPHPDLTDDSFVALTGAELDFTAMDNGCWECAVHINAISRDENHTGSYERMPLDYSLINKTVEKLKADGCYVTLNHPVWSNMSTEDMFKVKGVDAVEIFNSIGVMFNNYADDTPLYEYYLRHGGKAGLVAGDDTHKIFEDGTPFMEYYRSFTMLKAKELTYESLMDALEHGDCYASTGPVFKNLWLDGDILHVECSPVFGVYVHSRYMNIKTQDVRRTDCITETELDISEIRKSGSPYIWVQLRDLSGGKAWANPYWF